MVTLRCTKKLCKYLDVNPANNIELPTTEFGDWYGNLVPTSSGDLILFISERSLLTVAIPVWESDNLVPLFRLRVANLLVYVLKAFGHNLMETLCLSDRIIHLHFVDAAGDVKPGFAL
jgi:hypothetical protein